MKEELPFGLRCTFPPRVRAGLVHFLVSSLIAGLAFALVFGLWYPWPYPQLAGGQDLFFLLVSVDVTLGPLLTLAVFNPIKSRQHLIVDLAVIAVLQVGALLYGLHTMFVARPVALVFEVDRFRVISAAQVDAADLLNAPPQYRSLPLTGPWLLGTRASIGAKEQLDSVQFALEGVDLAQRPRYWQTYDQSVAAVLQRARPVTLLLRQYPEHRARIEELLRGAALDAREARFLPAQGRRSWVVLLNGAGEIRGFAPYEGFF